jgi:hypothetical protein
VEVRVYQKEGDECIAELNQNNQEEFYAWDE